MVFTGPRFILELPSGFTRVTSHHPTRHRKEALSFPFQVRRLGQGDETYPVTQLVGRTLVGHSCAAARASVRE